MESRRHLNLLLITDVPNATLGLTESLAQRGLSVVARLARSLGTAVSILEELRRPLPLLDLIVLDIGIDAEGGYDLIARVKADADFSHVPVVGVSKTCELFECARLARLGAVACVPRAELLERLPGLVARCDPRLFCTNPSSAALL